MAGLRIIFMGTPELAAVSLQALLHESAFHVVAVATPPDRPKGRELKLQPSPVKQIATRAGLPVLQPEKARDENFITELCRLQPDLIAVAAFGQILPKSILELPRFGCVNVHTSLLPKYRGAAPVHRAVMAGDETTGVTIMRVVAELDAGAMLATVTRPIDPDETSVDVERDLAQLGAAALVDVVNQLSIGPIVETPQDDALATYAPKIQKSESPIDWECPARKIHNRVRGLHPWPMASTTMGGIRCLIHRTRLTAQRTEASSGTVVEASGDVLSIATGDHGVLRILMIQPEGRRVMTVREFLSGHKVAPGMLLSRP